MTNEFNELLYDEIIPRLFRQLYDLDESQQTEEHEVDLIKCPEWLLRGDGSQGQDRPDERCAD